MPWRVKYRAVAPAVIDPYAFWALFLPVLAAFILVVVVPVIYVIVHALPRIDGILKTPDLWFHVRLTVAYTAATCVAQFVLGCMAAYLIWLLPIRLHALFIVLLFLPYTVPTVVVALMWDLLLQGQGFLAVWLESLFGIPSTSWSGDEHAFTKLVVASVWQFYPFVFITVYASLMRINSKLLIAASADGASLWTSIIRVVLPSIAPVLAVTFYLRWVFMFSKIDLARHLGGESTIKEIDLLALWVNRHVVALSPDLLCGAGLVTLATGLLFGGGVWLVATIGLWVARRLRAPSGARTLAVERFPRILYHVGSRLHIILKSALIVAFVGFTIVPVFVLVAAAFLPHYEMDRGLAWEKLFLIRWSTFSEHVRALLPGTQLWIGLQRPIVNSLTVSLATTLTVTLLSFVAGYATSRYPSRWRCSIQTAGLLVYLIPFVVIVIGINALYATWLAPTFAVVLADVALCLPLGAMLMAEYMRGIPIDVDRTAAADGAPAWRRALIIARQTLPGLITIASVSFLLAWNDTMAALFLNATTLPVEIAQSILDSELRCDYGLFATASLAIAAPACAVFAGLQLLVIMTLRRERSRR